MSWGIPPWGSLASPVVKSVREPVSKLRWLTTKEEESQRWPLTSTYTCAYIYKHVHHTPAQMSLLQHLQQVHSTRNKSGRFHNRKQLRWLPLWSLCRRTSTSTRTRTSGHLQNTCQVLEPHHSCDWQQRTPIQAGSHLQWKAGPHPTTGKKKETNKAGQK